MAQFSLKPPKELIFSGNLFENWTKFKEDLEIFFTAAAITDSDRKVAILQNYIGDDGKKIIKTLGVHKEVGYENVIAAIDGYVQPQKNLIASSFKFNSRNQNENESIVSYAMNLTQLIKECEYGPLSDRLLLDRIVLGVRDKGLQATLLREKKLDLKRAIEIGKTSEQKKQQQAKVLKPAEEIDKIQGTSSQVRQSFNNTPEEALRQRAGDEGIKYYCKKCPKMYKTIISLKRHQKYECGKEPRFKCTLCQFKTAYKNNLRIHFYNKHGIL